MINRHGRRGRYLHLAVMALLFLTLACSLPFVGGGQGDNSAQTPASASSEDETGTGEGDLRCQQDGYPCSYADAPAGAIDRSFALMDTAEEVFEKEGNAVAVARRLQEEGDIVEMYYDERGVWYRVEGAPPMIFLHPGAFSVEDGEASLPPGGSTAIKTMARRVLPEPDGPIGINPPGEKATKKALFLNPFAHQFGTDVYDAVNPLLNDVRDYQCEGCVDHKATRSDPKDQVSEENPEAGPSIEQFKGWETYDLIHVLAHGYQFCPGQSVNSDGEPIISGDREELPENTAGIVEGTEVTEGECVTLIQTGHYVREEHMKENPSNETGIAWAYKPGRDTWMEVVTTDFFQAEYGGGLDDKIIFFTSCQGLRDSSLADVLQGENTAVLGWTDYVKGSRGERVAVKFFEELIKNGLRVSVAHEKTKNSSSHMEHADDWHGAQLRLEKDGNGDPRGREVITWMHPIYREKLKDIGHNPVKGIPGDQEADDLLLLLQIDGVDEDQNPQDFTAHVKIDGREIDRDLKITKQISKYSHWIQAEIPLPGDSNSLPRAEIEAWVDLPEGGDTRHVLQEVEMADCGWLGSYSGGSSGSISGPEVIDTKDVASTDLDSVREALSSVGEGGGIPPGLDLESMLGGHRSFMMGNVEGVPFLTVGNNGVGGLVVNMPIAYVGDTVQYNISRDDGRVVEGSMSGPMKRGLPTGGVETVNVQADFEWHVGSTCSFKIKTQIIKNAADDGLIEGGD